MISSCQALLSGKWKKRRRLLQATLWLGMQIAGGSCMHYTALNVMQWDASFQWAGGAAQGLSYALVISVLIDALPLAGGWLGDERVSKFKLLAVGTVLYVIGCTFILLSTLRFGPAEESAVRQFLLILGLPPFAVAALCSRAVAPALLLQQLKRHFCSSIFNCVTWYYCCLNLGALVSDAIVYGSTPYVDSRKLGPLIFAAAAAAFAGLACGLPWIRELPPTPWSSAPNDLLGRRRLRSKHHPAVAAAEPPAAASVEEDPSACLFRWGLLAILACWVAIFTQMTSCLDLQLRSMPGGWQQQQHHLYSLFDPGFVFLLAPLLCWASSRFFKLHHMAWRFGIGQLVLAASALVAAVTEFARDRSAYQPPIVLPAYLLMALSEILVIVSGYEILVLLTRPSRLGSTIGLFILFFAIGRALSLGLTAVFVARRWIAPASASADHLQLGFLLLCGLQLLALLLYCLLWLRLRSSLTAPLHLLSDSLLGRRRPSDAARRLSGAGREIASAVGAAAATASVASSYDDSDSELSSSEGDWRPGLETAATATASGSEDAS
uniref:MFS_1_like domain-containing protein n=1 Tax=Macrostomum lignano TaxID=282301 RepID=A0A1I8IAR4_9PLAT